MKAARVAAGPRGLGVAAFAGLCVLLLLSAAWLADEGFLNWRPHPPGLVNAGGGQIGADFVSTWSAARLAIEHRPAAIYDGVQFQAEEERTIGVPVVWTPWFYPPILLLFITPLGLLPYLAALVLWLAIPALALAWLDRRIWPHPLAPVAAVIFPGCAQSILSGQNGVLIALTLAGGLLNLGPRPVAAGILLGLLGCKPQVAAPIFLALLVAREWRALASAIATVAALGLASLAVFGLAPWLAFLKALGQARQILELGPIPWERMATAFAALRLAGVGVTGAYAIEIIVALIALAALIVAWRRPNRLAVRGAILAVVIPLTTPYAFDYDLAILLLPILWLVRDGLDHGFRRGEIALLTAAWIGPVACWLIAEPTHVQLMPVILLLLLPAILSRRVVGVTAAT